MMLDAGALIAKHRGKGVLIDTNLLVLLLVGTINRNRILGFKRTDGYTPRDFELLARLAKWFGKLISTPHVLAQVSDLTALSGPELRQIRLAFQRHVSMIDERTEPSALLVARPTFHRLGLTDAAIAAVCERGTLVLTADAALHLLLQEIGADALNFNHVRQLGWKQ